MSFTDPTKPADQIVYCRNSLHKKKQNFSIYILFPWHALLQTDWIYLVYFPPTFENSCLLPCTPSPFTKGVYSKRKESAPIGSRFFIFIVDPFSEGRQNDSERVSSHGSESIVLCVNTSNITGPGEWMSLDVSPVKNSDSDSEDAIM